MFTRRLWEFRVSKEFREAWEDRVATHKSARKRARQAIKRRTRNRDLRTRTKGAVKRVRAALEANDSEGAQSSLRTAESVLRRAASKGALPKKRMSRLISRLAHHANNL